jgi:4-amino-4-deoxy-L-arabinose transferase-like glycosyltransferase
MKDRKKEFLLVLGILILASFLRLYKIADYMTFLGDEGRDVLVVKKIIVDHKLTLLGPTASVGGFFLGPLYYYLMVPFLWAFRLNPVGPAVMVALFGILTVWLVYKVGKEFFNSSVGLLSAGLYAISPLVVSYSRSSWNPNLMPLASLSIIWFAFQAVKKKDWRWFLIVGFLFGLAIQLHYLTTFLMAVIAIYFLIFLPKKFYLKAFFFSLFGFMVGWLPLILFEIRHNFPNFKTLYKFIFFGEETGFVANKFLPIISNVSFRLFNRLVVNNQKLLASFLIFLVSGFFIYFWFTEKKKREIYSLLGIWLFVGILLFGFYQKGIYDYYFGFMFPLPFLLTGLAIEKMMRLNKTFLYIAILLYCYIALVNLWGIPFRYPPNRQLEQTKTIVRFILEKAEGKPFNLALITGGNSDHAYRYFLEIWGNPPVTIQNFQNDPERKTVTEQLFVICESLPCSPLGHPLWEIAGFGRAEILGEWDVSVVKVYKLGHFKNEKINLGK